MMHVPVIRNETSFEPETVHTDVVVLVNVTTKLEVELADTR
jgi:hypothetical protein